MNLRPSGYEPDELPGCSTPRQIFVAATERPGFGVSGASRSKAGSGSASHVAASPGSGEREEAGLKREAGHSVLCRPGGDLLSHVLRQSTIGAKAFDGRVRDGIGSDRLARATRPAKDGVFSKTGFLLGERRVTKAGAGPASRRAIHTVARQRRFRAPWRREQSSRTSD